ncbi:MAG: transglutaminase-like domain-containing protein [Lachnospiraceae bacterium]|nr:transglutaminase-like domain-containing protein [Lachnospiraceae bacterium]
MISAAYDLLFVLPLILAAYSSAYPFIMQQDAPQGLLKYLMPLLICAVCLSFKHLKNKGRIILSAVLLTGGLTFFLSLPADGRLEGLLEYSSGIKLALLCLIIWPAGELLNRNCKLRAAVSFILFAALPVTMIAGYTAGKMCTCMLLIYLLLNLTDLYQLYSVKEGDTEGKKHLVFVSPFILAAFLLISFIPVSEKPYDWAVVKRIGAIVRDAVLDVADALFESGDGEEAFIGFSGKAGFKGKIKNNDSVSLILNTMNGSDQALYIAGRTFDRFTGTGWEEGSDTDGVERRMDAVETVCAVMEDTEEGKTTDVMMKISLYVKRKDKHQKTLFLPAKTFVIKEDEESRGRSYATGYYKLNRRSGIFEELLDRKTDIDNAAWNEALKELGIKDEKLSYENYLAYRQDIENRYMADITVSDKMREYLDGLLDGAESDYGKCCRIEEALREGKYNSEPGELPENISDAASYLDWFIFEKKEGYCSHYATAFVLMARSCGLRARYVQGFLTKLNSIGDSEVRSGQAHAWAEVYFEGTGWISFEATPGYGSRQGWKTYAELEEERAAAERKYADPHQGEGEDAADDGEDIESEEENKVTVIHWERILIPVWAGVVLAAILFAGDALYKRKKYETMDENEKCLYLCRQYISYFRRVGCVREEYETVGEFRNRLSGFIDDEFLDFLGLYERLLYAGEKAGEDSRKELEALRKPLKAHIKLKRKELREGQEKENSREVEDTLDF